MRWDFLGLTLSGSCLVHCLLLPVAIVAAPTLSLWLGETENTVHWALLTLALLVSGGALLGGFRRHAVAGVVMLGALGLLVMLVAASHVFGRGVEAALTLTGALIVAVAHLINLRLCTNGGDAPTTPTTR